MSNRPFTFLLATQESQTIGDLLYKVINHTKWQSDQLLECSDEDSSLTSVSPSVSAHHLDTSSGTDTMFQPSANETPFIRSWRTREQRTQQHRGVLQVDMSIGMMLGLERKIGML